MNGSVSCVLRYLEYLTLVCNVQEEKLHTELGCLFVRYITMIVKNSSSQVDVEKLKRDKNVNDLRARLRMFLTKSVLYEPLEIERLIVPAEGEDNVKKEVLAIKYPVRALLAKELAILKMRLGQVNKCFEICVQETKDVIFAQNLAKTGVAWLNKDNKLQGQEWQANDRLIWYNLFKKLMQSEDPELKNQGVKLLTKNSEHIPYKSLCQNFQDDDEVDEDTNMLFTKIFETMSS